MIRETLTTRGVSPELLNTVKQLHQKDSELGNQVLEEIVGKTLVSEFSKQDAPETQTAFEILRQYGQTTTAAAGADSKKQPLKVEDKRLRDLANKVADTMLKATSFTELWQFSRILPAIERIAPERADALKQKQAALKKNAPEGMFSFDSWNLLSEPGTDPEKLLAAASKVPTGITGVRGQFYQQAINKFAEKGDLERARQLVSALPAGEERDDALAEIDAKSAEKAVKDGKLDEARKLIGKIDDKSRQIEEFIKLAVAFYSKNDKESRGIALKIMAETNDLIDQTPQDAEEIEALVKIIAGYAVIDSPRAFALLEPLVEQSNDLLVAAALLSKYKKRESNGFDFDQDVFRNGELVINLVSRRMQNQMHFKREISLLAAADFARLNDVSDKFTRSDGQILVRLIIAQSILQKDWEGDKNASRS